MIQSTFGVSKAPLVPPLMLLKLFFLFLSDRATQRWPLRRFGLLCLPLAMALLTFSTTARAQSTFVTSNAYVEADVSSTDGLVSIFLNTTPASHNDAIVFPAQTSFLTVLVNGTYFTNNVSRLSSSASPVYPSFLNNGVTRKIGDTIETDWQPEGPNGFDIIQDVYPVEFATGYPISGTGQIVLKFKLISHENGFLSAQAQYLLDVDLSTGGNPPPSNDNAPITTRYGYWSTQWAEDPPANSIPPYFIATLQDLNNDVPGEVFPGLIAEGYLNDSLAPEPMGLMQPSLFAYTDWREIVTGYTFGSPNKGTQYPTIGDEALLIQWPNSGANQGQTVVLGSFSYGSAACQPICFGNLDAMLVHPDHVFWDPTLSTYVPNHFPVDGIVWNLNTLTATSANGTQTITNDATGASTNLPVMIESPNPPPALVSTQNHKLTGAGGLGSILGQSSASITWEDTVLQSVLTNCSTDSIYDIAFSVGANGVGPTTCSSSPYICPIIVDCQQRDLLAPRHTKHVGVGATNHCGNYTTFVDSVYDSRAIDQGIDSITWKVVPPNADKVTIATYPQCDHTDSVKVTVTQVDSLLSSCVYFTFTDCAANVSYDTFCFQSCSPPVPFDTLPPRFRLLKRYDQNYTDTSGAPCEFQCSEWVITDSIEEPLPGLQHDGGLRSVIVVDSSNMNFTQLHPLTLGMKEDTFTVCVTDSMSSLGGNIIIEAIDSAGNVPTYDTIRYCSIPDTVPPLVVVQTQTGGWSVSATDDRPWDTGVDSVLVSRIQNCWPIANPSLYLIDSINDTTCSLRPIPNCAATFLFRIQIRDTFASAGFTLQAWDCAGNFNNQQRVVKDSLADTFCPHDTIYVLDSSGTIKVFFSDIHDSINYDDGIDSIWFSNVHNYSMLYHGTISSIHTIKEDTFPGVGLPRYTKFDSVILFVTDTLAHDTLPAKICWQAVDGAGNELCAGDTFCWTYYLPIDSTPAFVDLKYDSIVCDSIAVTVTDLRRHDRGIYRVWDTLTQNLSNYSRIDSPAISLTFDLGLIDPKTSATGTLLASDVWGRQSTDTSVQALHTDTLPIAIYRQNLAMNATGIDSSNAAFQVPIYLDSTDAFPLSKKNLNQFQFTFQITGSNLLTFTGTANVNPAGTNVAAGWNISDANDGNRTYTISGQGPALTDLQLHDTIGYLLFQAAKSVGVQEADINVLTDPCGEQVLYNGGNDVVGMPIVSDGIDANGDTNYSITLPAPAGLLNGGRVIFMDSCATIVGNGTKPQILSIAPAIPNPFNGTTLIQYTVPASPTMNAASPTMNASSPTINSTTVSSSGNASNTMNASSPTMNGSSPTMNVKMELFNALGQNVRTLVDAALSQGTYRIILDAHGLQQGTYFIRLQGGGMVCSERVILAK